MFHNHLLDFFLRKSVEESTCNMTVFCLNIFEYKTADLGSTLINRKCLLAANILNMSIWITEIEAVNNERCHNLIHLDIVKQDLVNNSIFSPATSRLDPKSTVCIDKETVLNSKVYHSSCHFTSDRYRTMTVPHTALTDHKIFTWTFILCTHINFSGFNSNTVISQRKIYTNDLYIFA